jgi:hypothetical protein
LKSALAAAARFVAVSAATFAATATWPALVLAPAAWLAWMLAPAIGLTLGVPTVTGPAIAFARPGGPLVLEDPYVIAGIPLYLGLWAIARRPPRALPWLRVAVGALAIEVVAGLTVLLVALSVVRGWTATPAREPVELVALVLVAACRVLPLPTWFLLDPGRPVALPGPTRAPRPSR